VFRSIAIILFLTLLVAFAGCAKRDLRGKSAPSPDGKTYLVVHNNNGGACGSIMVDGRERPPAIHSAGQIESGIHKIACGDPNHLIEFEVKTGATFHFDYWGP